MSQNAVRDHHPLRELRVSQCSQASERGVALLPALTRVQYRRAYIGVPPLEGVGFLAQSL